MATARLRKTFQFPDDGSDGDEPEAMDEQEQEELIARLKKESDERNDDYLRAFLVIPAVSWVIFAIAFFRSPLSSARLLCVLGATSIIATAYNLLFIPTKPGASQKPTKLGSYSIPLSDTLSPAQRYVPLLNAVLSILIGIGGLRLKGNWAVDPGFWAICWVPLIEFVMIQMARKWIVEVDPQELEKLKYDFKGA